MDCVCRICLKNTLAFSRNQQISGAGLLDIEPIGSLNCLGSGLRQLNQVGVEGQHVEISVEIPSSHEGVAIPLRRHHHAIVRTQHVGRRLDGFPDLSLTSRKYGQRNHKWR